MFDKSDARTLLAPRPSTAPTATEFADLELARFYESDPQIVEPGIQTWLTRGQNFIVSYSKTQAGAVLKREDQADEYVIILPERASEVEITTAQGTTVVPGYSIAIVPAGDSAVNVIKGGQVVRLVTALATDLAAQCSNSASYNSRHPNIPPYCPWPDPVNGSKVRVYTLDVPEEPGRLGRIWRCSTFMINFVPVMRGPRDITKLSPHFHDDFEQCSLALEGAFTHHIRWPWTPDLNVWRPDRHELCAAPSVAIIPPPALHTSRSMNAGVNQLVDIFSPPRRDFSEVTGWVLNSDEYPMPE
jgi:hypothetical protein